MTSPDVGKLRELAEDALFSSRPLTREQISALAISALDALEAANKRLAQYEEPGWINAVQKVQQVKAERDRLAEALRKSAERLHGLSEDPTHLSHASFKDCPDHACIEAAAALAGVPGGSPEEGAVGGLVGEQSDE